MVASDGWLPDQIFTRGKIQVRNQGRWKFGNFSPPWKNVVDIV